jgi:long-chain acyl-CoA synthetase
LELNEIKSKTPPSASIKINALNYDFNYLEEVEFESHHNKVKRLKELKNVCMIKYTAAVNGYPQAVMLTKNNITANARAVLNCDHVDKSSVCCALAPFNALYGFQTGLFAPLTAGATILIEDISNLNGIRKIADDIKEHHVTNIYSIPVVYYLLTKVSDIKNKIKSVKTLVSGGYKLPESIAEKFLKITGKIISEGYGLTEASPICAWHRPGDKIKTGTVGRSFSCCDIKILDEENNEFPPGEVGEVCIKGENVMKGYFNNPELTSKTIVGEWLHTGDLGKMDEDGYLTIMGIKKQMCTVFGQNVYPREVEKLISFNNNVRKVYVFGESNGIIGHSIQAVVSLKKNGESSKKKFKIWLKENLTKHKVPTKIKFSE